MSPASLCLTIDIDWAHDAAIADALKLVAEAGVAATWFVTHATPVLADIRATPRQELGLHPNFNPLLDGSNGNARNILRRIRDVVPDATCIRSHSLTRSSRLAALFREHGYVLTALRAFDLFPMTHHVECVAQFTRRDVS